jgi:hypothetical protein
METINHELIHAAVDRSIASFLNPDATFTDNEGKVVKILNDNTRKLMNQPMSTLSAVIDFSYKAINDKKGAYHKYIKVLKDRYEAAKKEGDLIAMKELAFVPNVFGNIEEFVKLHGAEMLADVDGMNFRQQEKYASIMKEFVAYFMSNREFQNLLNRVELNNTKKTIWQQVVDAFIEILNLLTGNGVRKLTSDELNMFEEIRENTLAEVAAVASIDLIEASRVTRPKTTMKKVSKFDFLYDVNPETITDEEVLSGLPDNNIYVVYGDTSGKGPYSGLANQPNLIVFPIKHSDGRMFTEKDIPFIKEQFAELTEMALDYNYVEVVNDLLDNDFANYKESNFEVYNALLAGKNKLGEAMDNRSADEDEADIKSYNSVDLFTDLLDFKFDQAEIDEISAYKKCK